MAILLADSGATKCEWCYIDGKKKTTVMTQGISPYFLNVVEIENILRNELVPSLKKKVPEQVFYYGTGCAAPENASLVKKAIKKVFTDAEVNVTHDLMGAARATCGNEKGISCILGTGSNSCYFNGKKIVKNSPGLGFILGDEGSGAYLGKKVIQYYLYDTFDEELKYRFNETYKTDKVEILDHVYRGHFMIENIIEDGLNDFFFQHLNKYNESWKNPIHFVGGVAHGFQDVIRDLCSTYEFELGSILKNPMEGLVIYHSN
jgi:N-acetylglucosamine kinase-like BadF-type ATPase